MDLDIIQLVSNLRWLFASPAMQSDRRKKRRDILRCPMLSAARRVWVSVSPASCLSPSREPREAWRPSRCSSCVSSPRCGRRVGLRTAV